jgi:arginine deiminase
MFRFTLSTVSAVASVGATATPLETGMTPIPPLNFTRESSAAAESGVTIPKNSTQTDIFFNMAISPFSLNSK